MDRIRVRILLRVSSTGQLDADGDMDIQRRIVLDYVKEHEKDGWYYDEADSKSEYFEGGVSGYKNPVDKRPVLVQILKDAKNHEFDALVCYKEDRIGRCVIETNMYIEELAKYGVIVYTVKDCMHTPNIDIEEMIRIFKSMPCKLVSSRVKHIG